MRRALEEDPQMREMVTTPLMLNIVTLVYQGKASAPFPIASALEARQERVFAMYVKRMLARQGEQEEDSLRVWESRSGQQRWVHGHG